MSAEKAILLSAEKATFRLAEKATFLPAEKATFCRGMATLCRRNGHLSAGRKGHLSEKATFLSAERPLLCRQANYLGGLASARRTGAAVCVCAASVGAVVTWHDVHEMRGSRLLALWQKQCCSSLFQSLQIRVQPLLGD